MVLAVDGNTSPLRNAFFDFVESCRDITMSVWDVAEIASNPASSLWDNKGEWIIGGVCDESGVLVVASGTKTCDE